MGDALNSFTAATNYASESTAARTNATLAKKQSYADAYRLESDSEAALHMAGDNLMVMRRNQSEQVAGSRAAAGASGFSASGGSNLVREQSVAEVLEMAIANAARSAAVSDVNAREQADMLRRQGETEYNLGMVQADFLQRMGRISKSTAGWQLGAGVANTAGAFGVQTGTWLFDYGQKKQTR